MSEATARDLPAWVEPWITTPDDRRPYDEATIAHMRIYAKTRADVRAAMLTYPPHCVITFEANNETTYGIVTGVCTIVPDKQPKKKKRGTPDSVVAIRFVPSPLHMAGATSPDEREAAYVMPAGVSVVGYSPRYTPDTMRVFIAPLGCA